MLTCSWRGSGTLWAYRKCVSKRIFKFHQYVVKLWTRVYNGFSCFGSQCRSHLKSELNSARISGSSLWSTSARIIMILTCSVECLVLELPSVPFGVDTSSRVGACSLVGDEDTRLNSLASKQVNWNHIVCSHFRDMAPV